MPTLLDELACARRLVAFGHALDRHDLDTVIAQFADDAVLHRAADPDIVGTDALRAFWAQRKKERVTRHILAPPHICVNDDGTAQGAADFIFYVAMQPSESSAPLPMEDASVLGEFQASFRRIDNDWKIAGLRSIVSFKK